MLMSEREETLVTAAEDVLEYLERMNRLGVPRIINGAAPIADALRKALEPYAGEEPKNAA